MSVSVSFVDATGDGAAVLENVLVIAHCAAALDTDVVPPQLAAALGPGALEALKYAASQAKPGKESTGSAETFVAVGEGRWQRLAVGLLPTKAASRHAAPGHPHAVCDLVRSKQGSGDLAVFLLLADPLNETFSACCAVARAFPLYSHKSSGSSTPTKVTVYTCIGPELFANSGSSAVQTSELSKVAEGIREAARLVDAPPNELNVSAYVDQINKWAGQLPGVQTTVIRGEELRERGLGGIYGVGKASADPPALVILSHNAESASESACIIGKGIVYDTGGLSIKTKSGMPGMKRDMGGSAGVLGAFYSIVSNGGLEGGRALHAVLCIAENSVGSEATRPDDIHVFYSGKTVEINNTDAEGRLVMADGLAYAVRHLNPGVLINMATLTGAQSSATGLKHAAVFTNSEAFEDLIVASGRRSGDLTHPLPYAPEFFRPEFKSAVADMKNSQKNRSNAGCAAPATFLSNHIEPYLDAGKPWLHIDMASPAYSGERATGYGVALLYLAAREFSKL